MVFHKRLIYDEASHVENRCIDSVNNGSLCLDLLLQSNPLSEVDGENVVSQTVKPHCEEFINFWVTFDAKHFPQRSFPLFFINELGFCFTLLYFNRQCVHSDYIYSIGSIHCLHYPFVPYFLRNKAYRSSNCEYLRMSTFRSEGYWLLFSENLENTKRDGSCGQVYFINKYIFRN